MNKQINFEEQDPDYAAPGPSTSYQQKIYEETARTNTSRKITSIIDREFSLEIDAKEKEILKIQETLDKALKALNFLRYVIISDFYNRKQCLTNPPEDIKQTRLHPAIRSATGKSPKCHFPSRPFLPTPLLGAPSNAPSPRSPPLPPKTSEIQKNPPENPPAPKCPPSNSPAPKRPLDTPAATLEPPRKIPRYIPPKDARASLELPSRGVRHKVRKRIIVGNISKWIPTDWREDAASHKWTMYVRGSKEESDISDIVSKVRFFLHPSYAPNDVVDVTSAPFHLCRRGWGEFPLRVQLHFKNTNNKPMDIIHHLKLDRTYTGLQTLGSETVVDIWINTLSVDLCDNRLDACDRSKIGADRSKIGADRSPSGADRVLTGADRTLTDPDRSLTNPDRSLTDPDQSLTDPDRSLTNPTLSIPRIVNDRQEHHPPKPDDEVMVLSHVQLEHDYAISRRPEDCNTTIAHSPPKTAIDVRHSVQNVESVPPQRILHNGQTDAKFPANTIQNGASVLQPLTITIPANFESLNRQQLANPPVKQILVLKNSNDRVIKLKMQTTKVVSVLKKPTSLLNLKVDPSKSIILNATSTIPVLKIADVQNFPNASDKPNGKWPRPKITLGKDKTNLGSKREFYDGILRSLEEVRIPGDMHSVMRYIVKRIPIVSPHSGDAEYRRMHPYACASADEFLQFNPAKQRALEWYRAKFAREILKRRSGGESELWSVKEIMIWCRLYGFTPGNSKSAGKCEKSVEVLGGEFGSCTEPGELIQWIQESKEAGGVDLGEVEEDVDVVGEGEHLAGNSMNEAGRKQLAVMEVPRSAEPMCSDVCRIARQIGVRLEGEEVVEGVKHDAAARVIAKAVECLMEDLLRSSLAKATERNGCCPEIINLDDVKSAIMSREEFDIFTNENLATQNG